MSVVGTVLALSGILLIALAGIGLLRLPDVYSRLNAAGKAAGLGIVLVLLGDLVTTPGWATAAKVVLAIVLQLVTVPVGSFALGRAAYRSGAPLWQGTLYDELADESTGEAAGPPRASGPTQPAQDDIRP